MYSPSKREVGINYKTSTVDRRRLIVDKVRYCGVVLIARERGRGE